jgi:hypothetical protein
MNGRTAAILVGLVAILCFATSGDASSASLQSTKETTHQSAVLDQSLVTLDLMPPASVTPSVDESHAIARATSALATASPASSVQTRQVTLTLRKADGAVAWGIQARPVWLITFQGIGYPLASATAGDCACAAYYWRPSTIIAIDARTGDVLLKLGVAS